MPLSSASSHTTGHEPTVATDIHQQTSSAGSCHHFAHPSARNLVVCIDGTSNKFSDNNTNVVKLFAKIDLESTEPHQLAYYSSGIGTSPKKLDIKRRISDTFDLAIALNLEEIVKDAYGWLARTYQNGDRIYLLGFSRGAYQVRVLAGMIHEVGLIRTPTEKQIAMAYDHYEDARSGRSRERQLARGFKNTFSWDELKVHFIGVWDTVSAVGFIRRDVSISSSSSAAHACHFRHALALDERRVKFMPEYFCEMNSRTEDVDSRYVVTSAGDILPTSSIDIKEVWFAGSHSDVGGRSKHGNTYQAGNVSLLWMRREAAANGLVLKPTDIVWVPDDLDLGITCSMNIGWSLVERVLTKHQVSFTGAGEDGWRHHMAKPRRIIPGQKVHASVLYANAYWPQASLGEGFDIPIVHADPETKKNDSLWETGLFDDTVAQELVTHLGDEQGATSIYIDRLLFMLRVEEGRQCIRKIQDWQDRLVNLTCRPNAPPLIGLVATVAYYETSCNFDQEHACSPLHETRLPRDILDRVEQSIRTILGNHRHRDGPMVFALLKPLTKHQVLGGRILTKDVLKALIELLDTMLKEKEGHFGQLVDGLNCLLHCSYTQSVIIKRLQENSRLSKMLRVSDTRHLTAVLRVVMTLAQLPHAEANAEGVWSTVQTELHKLARKESQGLIGPFAVEISLAIYKRRERSERYSPVTSCDLSPLDTRNAHVRANLYRALICSDLDQRHSANEQDCITDHRQQMLCKLFGLGEPRLGEDQKKLIGELRSAVKKRNVRERTAATMTLVKLCETEAIRDYLLEVKLLDDFLCQLRRKDTALLAAYALAACLKYSDMESKVDNELLANRIVDMIRLDYFDDAVGTVEGFQIFGDLMQHESLRVRIKTKNEAITKILYTKLGNGKRKEARTSLICLDIFRCFDRRDSWTRKLVDDGLDCLRGSTWKGQKAGVTILASLAQTEHGVAAIILRIKNILNMLLPEGYLQTAVTTSTGNTSSLNGSQGRPPISRDAPPKPSFGMMGPACALRILAQNEKLRNATRDTVEYKSLKNLFKSGTLISEADTKAWTVHTPNRADVTDMLEKMIKAVDEELLEDGLMSIGDDVLPHIEHWGRFLGFVADMPVAVFLTLLSAPLVVIWASIALVATPIVLPALALLKRMQESRVARRLERLRGPRRDHGGEESLMSRISPRMTGYRQLS